MEEGGFQQKPVTLLLKWAWVFLTVTSHACLGWPAGMRTLALMSQKGCAAIWETHVRHRSLWAGVPLYFVPFEDGRRSYPAGHVLRHRAWVAWGCVLAPGVTHFWGSSHALKALNMQAASLRLSHVLDGGYMDRCLKAALSSWCFFSLWSLTSENAS